MISLFKGLFSATKAPAMLSTFEERKCIFFHIPKTAGMSVSSALFGNIEWGHRTATFYINYFGQAQFDLFYKFTVVRNPYDRLYSAFTFLKNGGINQQDSTFSKQYLSSYPSFDDFVMNGLNDEVIKNWVHFLPQHYFVTDKSGSLVVDFVAKMEYLHTDFNTICKSLNISAELETKNQTKHKKEMVLTDEVKSVIKAHYIKDFTLFYPDLS